ncbi:MAG: cytochrome c [Stellaceae bacterium]
MKAMKLLALAIIVVAVLVGAGWFVLHARDPTEFAGGSRVVLADYKGPDPTGVPAALAGAGPLVRGEYLTRAADCAACHTAPGGKQFAGGRAFKLPFGTLYSPNITADKETGIGDWSDDDFIRALHKGIGKDGKYLYPAFPYPSYTLMTRNDALAIKTYLFSLKPIRDVAPADNLAFPFNQRYLMVFWNLLFNPDHRFRPNIDQTAEWNRGAYLSEALGHCGDCHTPRNLFQALDSRQKYAGAVIEGWKAYNITLDPVWGIGAWSTPQLVEYLSTGHALHRSTAAGPMGGAVDDGLRFLVKDDLSSMTAYLKSIPPLADSKNPAAVRTPPAGMSMAKAVISVGGGQSLGLRVFEGACASCHSFDGSGTITPYAALAGNRSVNDPEAVNLTQVLFDGARLHTPDGTVFMPSFGAGYSDAEIAAVANYVTGRFGTSASSVTPDEVAKRRKGN